MPIDRTRTSFGIGPGAPIAVNERGGMGSKLDYRFDLIDGPAMFRLARVLDYGAKRYAPDNWRKVTEREHVNHLLVHAYAWLSGDESDDHLGHMLTRAMMAAAVAHTNGYSAKQGDEI